MNKRLLVTINVTGMKQAIPHMLKRRGEPVPWQAFRGFIRQHPRPATERPSNA